MHWLQHGILIVMSGLYLPIRTDGDASSVKEETETACCNVTIKRCDHNLNSTRERRLEEYEGGDIIQKSGRKNSENGIFNSRKRRQTDADERMVNQLRVNLMEFQACLCTSNSTIYTCQMLFPPKILRSNETSNFLMAFEETTSLKRFDCAMISGDAIICTLRASYQSKDNISFTVLEGNKDKDAVRDSKCLACVPVLCTFSVFKTRLSDSKRTFIREFNQCIEQNGMSATVQREGPPQLTVAAEATTIPDVGDVMSTNISTRNKKVSRLDLWHETNHTVLQTTVNTQETLPDFGQAGILMGLGVSSGMKRQRLARWQIAHTTDYYQVSPYLIIAGAVVGGVFLGAMIMSLVIYGFFRKKMITECRRVPCTPRCSTVCQVQGPSTLPHCNVSSHDQVPTPHDQVPTQHDLVPIARVTPMSIRPQSCLPSSKTTIDSSSSCNLATPIQTRDTDSRWAISDCSGTYSYVAANDDHILKLCDPARTRMECHVTYNADYDLAHYEIPHPSTTRSPVIRRAGSLPVIYHYADDNRCFTCGTWTNNRLFADLPEGENEYMEIKPDPDPEHDSLENENVNTPSGLYNLSDVEQGRNQSLSSV